MKGDLDFAFVYVPAAQYDAVASLWALDATLARIVATTRDAMMGRLRLTWWHAALSALGADDWTGEPVLDTLARHVVPSGIAPRRLADLVEGWEALLEPMPLTAAALSTYARARGDLFDLTEILLGAALRGPAGEGWALADFAVHCSDPSTAARARAMALDTLATARVRSLPRPLRILARLAERDVRAGTAVPRTRWALFRAAY